MDVAVVLRDYWPVIVGVVLVIAEFTRLEVKVSQLDTDLTTVKAEQLQKETVLWTKIDGLQTTCTNLLTMVARLEGKLENKKD